MDEKEIVMYSRSTGCPFVTIARRVLDQHHLPYREIFIDQDQTAKQRVLDWTGFLSVPTIIIANCNEDLPYTHIEPLPAGKSPRGIDRGPMITEASTAEVEAWLRKHDFI